MTGGQYCLFTQPKIFFSTNSALIDKHSGYMRVFTYEDLTVRSMQSNLFGPYNLMDKKIQR